MSCLILSPGSWLRGEATGPGLVESTPGLVLCPAEALGTRQTEGYIISQAAWAARICRGEAAVHPGGLLPKAGGCVKE